MLLQSHSILFEGINPEPWTAPFIPKRGGVIKDRKLQAYQNAIKEAFDDWDRGIYDVPLDIQFYFWRNKSGRAKDADATNLQKSLEDALQGHLFVNDRNNQRISSEIMAQGPDVEPLILVFVAEFEPIDEPVGLRNWARANSILMEPKPPTPKTDESDFSLSNQYMEVDF